MTGKKLLKNYWFTLLLLTSVLLGFLFPRAAYVLNRNSTTTFWVVIVLFFNMGFTLPGESIGRGLSRISLHIYIQIFIFIVTPLFFLLTSWPFRSVMDGMFIAGIFALSVLPTTVSSCSIFTSVSGGNTAGTIFNATLSNILGIVVSPFLLSLIMKETGGRTEADLGVIMLNLAKQIAVPFAAGQLLRRFVTDTAVKFKKRIGILNNILISFTVFMAMSKTASNDLFISRLPQLVIPFFYLALAHFVLLFLARFGGRLLKFSREDMISITYAAPQKTLAMGVPLLSVYFAGEPELLSVALLPLVFYHPWQLVVAGFVQNRLKKGEINV